MSTKTKDKQVVTPADAGEIKTTGTDLVLPGNVPSFLQVQEQEPDVFAAAIADQPHDDTEKICLVRIDHDEGMFVLGATGSARTILGYPIFDFMTRGWWSKGYQEGASDPPECMSLDMIRPSSSSTSKQSTMCGSCKWSKFGSAPVGKGQACRTITHLFIANPSFGTPPILCLLLPPSSIRGYKGGDRTTGYKDAAKHFKDARGREAKHHEVVFTEFSLEPGGQKHYEIVCKPLAVAASADEMRAIAGIRGKYLKAMQLLQTDPVAIAEAGKPGE